jgi:hypothetical protein
MTWVATAIIGGAVIGGIASNRAANTQANAANNATAATQQQNAQTRADMAPWRAAGQTALNSIGDLMGTSGNTGAQNYGSLMHQFDANDLKSNLAPNYDFMLQQGLGATTNAGNAAGFSGNTLKGINDYAQGYAGNAYQQAFSNYTANQTNIYNRLSNLAGLGQTANQVTGALGSANTLNANNFATSGAAANAAGIVGGANAVSNGLSNYAGWNYLNGGSSPYSSPNAVGGEGVDPYGYLGGAATAGDYSDVRLKTDIRRVGTTDGGLPVYTYRYKAGGPMRMGVMAQEVEQVAPEAVSHDAAGWKKVNYSRLAEIGHAH